MTAEEHTAGLYQAVLRGEPPWPPHGAPNPRQISWSVAGQHSKGRGRVRLDVKHIRFKIATTLATQLHY